MSNLQTALISAGLIKPTYNTVERDKRYDGLWYCFKNVIRTNNSKKLSYCKG